MARAGGEPDFGEGEMNESEARLREKMRDYLLSGGESDPPSTWGIEDLGTRTCPSCGKRYAAYTSEGIELWVDLPCPWCGSKAVGVLTVGDFDSTG